MKIGLLCKKLTGSDFQEKVEWIEEPVDRWRFCFIFLFKKVGMEKLIRDGSSTAS